MPEHERTDIVEQDLLESTIIFLLCLAIASVFASTVPW